MRAFMTALRFLCFFYFALLFPPPVASLFLSLGSPISIQQRDGVQTTENGLSTDRCKLVTLIYAKGTTEAGNVGHYVGPAFIKSLRGFLGSSRIMVQGVAYEASVGGYFAGGDSGGSAQMVTLIKRAASRCPSTQLALGGYSQGAQLVHNAADQLPLGIVSRIIAVVLFGDPNYGQNVGPIAATDPRIDTICQNGDIVCTGSGGLQAHYAYIQDADAAANFVVGQAGLLD